MLVDKRAETGLAHTPSVPDEAQFKTTLVQLSTISPNEPRGGKYDSQVSGRIQALNDPLPRSVPEENQARTTGLNLLGSRVIQESSLVNSTGLEFDSEGTAVRRVNSLQMLSTYRAPDHNALRKTTSAPEALVRHNKVNLEAQVDDRIVSQFVYSGLNLVLA